MSDANDELASDLERDMVRVDAAAALVMDRCPHCEARYELVAVHDGLPRAVGITHECGCPDWLPEWPPDKPASDALPESNIF